VLGGAVAVAAPWIVGGWLRPARLAPGTAERSVALMGLLVVVQWPLSFYAGGLLGLQRAVRLNVIRFVGALLAAGGSVFVLFRLSPTVTAFLAWQVIAGTLVIVALVASLWRALPAGERRPRVSMARFREVRGFATGTSVILITGALLSQLDRIVLSRALPLGAFGYYMLAATVGAGLYVVINPVFNAVFPRFSKLHAAGSGERLAAEYRAGARAMAVLVLPVALTASAFAGEFLLLWTGDPVTARAAAPCARLLLIGTAVNGLMHLPYALQLAHGCTSIGLRLNLGLLASMGIGLAVLVPRFDGVGAAAAWLGVNVLYMAVAVPWTHRRLLGAGSLAWWPADVGPALVASAAAVAGARALWPDPSSRAALGLGLAAAGLAALGAAVLATPGMRRKVLELAGRA
jgi:O-antigen/teichoic acid export membrane protein